MKLPVTAWIIPIGMVKTTPITIARSEAHQGIKKGVDWHTIILAIVSNKRYIANERSEISAYGSMSLL
jgi:hypothetical protein